MRTGQKPYTLPDGTVIDVDAAIPDAILDRLNKLPHLECEATCSGGHRPWIVVNGKQKPAPPPRGPKWNYPMVLNNRAAKAGFCFIQPGKWSIPDVDGYLIYKDGAHLWIVATTLGSATPEWWEGLCQILEGITKEEGSK